VYAKWVQYQSDDEMVEQSWDGMDMPMSVKLSKVFTVGTLTEPVYDFGSSTCLQLIVDSIRSGPSRKNPVLMLSRNAPVERACEVCGNAPATIFCSQCRFESEKLEQEYSLKKPAVETTSEYTGQRNV
jgi:hypothetical protein